MLQNRENRREYIRAYYHKRRKMLIEFLGGKCSVCGGSKELQFDHIDRKNKKFGLSSKMLSYSIHEILSEAKKCQLLCSTCHNAKTQREKDHSDFARGSRVGSSKLTEQDVSFIKSRLGKQSMLSMAKHFGVDEKVIRCIKNGTTWKHVT
jgi:hypothetical protein